MFHHCLGLTQGQGYFLAVAVRMCLGCYSVPLQDMSCCQKKEILTSEKKGPGLDWEENHGHGEGGKVGMPFSNYNNDPRCKNLFLIFSLN